MIMFRVAWPKPDQMRHATRRSFREMDFVGGFLLIAASVLVVFSFQQGGIVANAWGTAIFIVPLVVGSVCWVLFFGWEIYISRRFGDSMAAMFPLRLLQRRVYIAAVLSTLLTGFPYYVVIYNLPLYFQVVYGKSALGAGVGLLPLLGASAVTTMLGGLISGKKDRTFATLLVGACLMVIGTALLSTLSTNVDLEARAYGYQVFIGLGFGLTVSVVSLLATVESQRKNHGRFSYSSVLWMLQQLMSSSRCPGYCRPSPRFRGQHRHCCIDSYSQRDPATRACWYRHCISTRVPASLCTNTHYRPVASRPTGIRRRF